MKNITIKTSVAALSIISVSSLATASIPIVDLPTQLPEPGTFGLFAGAAAAAIILARLMKKK